MNANNRLRRITATAMLVAVGVILAEVLCLSYPSAANPTLRFSLGYLPILLAGLLFGPVYGAIAGIIQDLLGFFLFQSGVFHLGYTLNAMLYGLVPGLLFAREWKHEKGFFYVANYVFSALFLAGTVWYFFHLTEYNTSAAFALWVKYLIASLAVLASLSVAFMNYRAWKHPQGGISRHKLLFLLSVLYVLTSLIFTPLWIISVAPTIRFWNLIPIRLAKMPIDVAIYQFLTPKMKSVTQKIFARED